MTATLSYKIPESFSAAASVEDFYNGDDIKKTRALEAREQPQPGKPSDGCKTNLFFGFFFDGTKNNYIKAEAGKNHSNVARLYDCYPGLSVPGVLPNSCECFWRQDRFSCCHTAEAFVAWRNNSF
jgi:hypothetical protein